MNPLGGKHPPPVKVAAAKDDILQFEITPPEEEKEDKVEDLDESSEDVLAPPTLIDLPTAVSVDAFTTPIEPPPPPGVTKGSLTIPVAKPAANFGGGLKDLFDINNLDQKPMARVQPGPIYPYEMSRAGINGDVVIEFIINTIGDVIQTQVVRSSHREFEAPAIQAVSKWKFKPGRKGGRAVNVRASQLIEFNLEDNK